MNHNDFITVDPVCCAVFKCAFNKSTFMSTTDSYYASPPILLFFFKCWMQCQFNVVLVRY